jgi:hypothetical protein
MKRTPLLLLIGLSACLSLAAAQPAPDSGWQQSQRRDAADTYNFTHFTLTGAFVGSAPGGTQRPTLTVDCIPSGAASHAKFLGSDLLVGKTLKIEYVEPQEIRGTNYFPKVTAEYRLDGSGGHQQDWSAGTDRIPTAKPSDKSSATVPKNTLKKFLRAHTVSITVADEHDVPLEMQFNIPDSAAIKSACSVD